MKIRLVVILVSSIVLFCGCATSKPQITREQAIKMKVKDYDTFDASLVMKTAMTVLQKEGYSFQNFNEKFGVISALREADQTNIITGTANTLIGIIASEETWAKNADMECSLNINRAGAKVRVRANFRRKLKFIVGGTSKIKEVNDSAFYQAFFNKISEGLSEMMASQTAVDLTSKSMPDSKPVITGASKPLSCENGFAVIIGISNYHYAGQNGLTNLIFADDDAIAFAKSLKAQGWNDSHIKLLINEDANERNIRIALESWSAKVGPDDMFILYWSGHAFPDPQNPEKVYFACYDTDINIPATGYRMDRVRASLEEHHAKNVIVLADTCHAGKIITRGEKGISIVPHIKKIEKEKSIPKGWIYMVGADSDRLAIENSSWSNGAFTHCLIKGLSGNADGYQSVGLKDGMVTMGELRAYLNSFMPDETHKILGVPIRPLVTTSSGDPNIWNLTLQKK